MLCKESENITISFHLFYITLSSSVTIAIVSPLRMLFSFLILPPLLSTLLFPSYISNA
ncbi:hypothetical protein HOY80DRAFT_942178 [Tuber brumale]|nr:hypothetical protein HOY80DRAFT_942178 [Tuber brumale]